jgi:hypothetical protein
MGAWPPLHCPARRPCKAACRSLLMTRW